MTWWSFGALGDHEALTSVDAGIVRPLARNVTIAQRCGGGERYGSDTLSDFN
jgi:hypothetical protein